MSRVLQLPAQPNMLNLLKQGQAQPDGGSLPLPYPDVAENTANAQNVPRGTPPPAAPAGPPMPSESAQLSAQLAKFSAPPTGREAALKAILAFAPTAIAGAVGGLPAAAGAAQGTQAEFSAEAARKEKERESLVAQVQAARQREQQSSEFGQTLGLHREQIGAENQRNTNTIAAENARAAATAAELKRYHDEELKRPTTVSPGTGLVRPGENAPFYTQPATPKTDNLSNLSKTTVTYQGKPVDALEDLDPGSPTKGRMFIQTANGLQDITGQASHYEKPAQQQPIVVPYSVGGENFTGLLDRSSRQISPLIAPGGGEAGAKVAEPPATVKTQGSAALTALRQVDNIEKIVRENPQLVGPIVGRFEQFMMGVGSNPFAGTKDERQGAALAEHLNALFAQELRSMFPGRTNEQMQELIKSTSAQLKQNPNMMMGILDGIRRNEGMVLETAKAQGFREDVHAQPKQAGPKVGDVVDGYIFQGGNPADQKNWKKK